MNRCRLLISMGSFAVLAVAGSVPAHGQYRMQKSPPGQSGVQPTGQQGGGMQKMCGKGQAQTPFGQTGGGMQTPFGQTTGGMQSPKGKGGGMPKPILPMFGQGGGLQTPFASGGGMTNPLGQGGGLQTPMGQGGAMMNPLGQQGAMQYPLAQAGGMQYPVVQGGGFQNPLAQGADMQNPLMQYGSSNGQFDAAQMQMLMRAIETQAAALQLQAPITTTSRQSANSRKTQQKTNPSGTNSLYRFSGPGQ